MNNYRKLIIGGGLITAGIFLVLPFVLAQNLNQKLSGKILLQVQSHGEAWYVNPASLKRYYLGRAADAYALMKTLGVGITNKDLSKILTADANLAGGADSDHDELSDATEDSFDTNKNQADSDSDGYGDKQEIVGGYDPLSSGSLPLDAALAKANAGKILLQIQSHGEAWYVNPADNKRYFLGRPADAYQIMRSLGLGITDKDLATIPSVGDETPTSQTTAENTGCANHDPDCDSYHLCVNNICQLRSGCIYNNPGCAETETCVNNACQTKTGCAYNKPACGANYNCVDNACQLKAGCAYNNPACNTGYQCLNNICMLRNNNNDNNDKGCDYDNPPCGSHYNCVKNVCQLKTGCAYGNPACGANYQCVINACVLKSGCAYNNPRCGPGYVCANNNCVPLQTTN